MQIWVSSACFSRLQRILIADLSNILLSLVLVESVCQWAWKISHDICPHKFSVRRLYAIYHELPFFVVLFSCVFVMCSFFMVIYPADFSAVVDWSNVFEISSLRDSWESIWAIACGSFLMIVGGFSKSHVIQILSSCDFPYNWCESKSMPIWLRSESWPPWDFLGRWSLFFNLQTWKIEMTSLPYWRQNAKGTPNITWQTVSGPW